MSNIRQLAQENISHHIYFNDAQAKNWNIFCGAMDAVDDLHLAVMFYLSKEHKQFEPKNRFGHMYFCLNGIAQCLYTQIKSVREMWEKVHLEDKCFNKLLEKYSMNDRPIYKIINAIRHPAKVRGFGNDTFVINRNMSSEFHVEGYIYDNQGNEKKQMPWSQPISINIHELIQKQQQAISKILENIIQKMEKDHMNHKNENNNIDFFIKNNVSYYLGKIIETLLGHQSMEYGCVHINYIIEHYEKVKGTLEQIGEYQGIIADYYQHLEHALNSLKDYFKSNTQSNLTKQDAYIFVYGTTHIMGKVNAYLKDICGEYKTPTQLPSSST